jgi:glycine oxidase
MRQSGRVRVPQLIAAYRHFLLQKGQLQTLSFDYSALKIETERVVYDTWTANKLVFCEGSKAMTNPFFDYLPFRGSKGELLIIEIPDFEPQRILKHQVFFVPLGNHRFWIGATAQDSFSDDAPSDYGRAYLTEKLDKILTVPYRIISHEAGVRPTVKDRRPFLGVHPKFPNLFIFNGLGGKGSSLAPFFAQQLTDFLLKGSPLDAEVDIRRFEKK